MSRPPSVLLAVALAAAVFLAGPRPAAAAAPEDVRQQVERLLLGYEPKDPGEALRRLGPPAADVLLLLARDEARPLLRLRAIEALGHLPTAAGLQHLQGLVARHGKASEPGAVYELAAAARALGGFGAQGEGTLGPLLESDSADVREGAAAGLGRVGSETAQRALRARLDRERDRGVRGCLERALRPTRK